MGWNFRKRVKVAPGIKLNISKSGISTTIGGNGASVNVGTKGIYGNMGIPGTGIHRRERLVAIKHKKATKEPKLQGVYSNTGIMQGKVTAEEPEQLGTIGLVVASLITSAFIGLLFSWGANSTFGCVSAVIVFFAIILVRLYNSSKESETKSIFQPEPPAKPTKDIVNPSAPKKWSKKQRLHSVEKLEAKRMKKKYLSEHSEYISVPVEDLRNLLLNTVGYDPYNLMEEVLNAILDGNELVRIKREAYEKQKSYLDEYRNKQGYNEPIL